MAEFDKAGAVVLGISGDAVDVQSRFKGKCGLPFTLLSDPGLEAARAFGVVQEKSTAGRTRAGIRRSTFVIGPDGIVEKVFPSVTPEGHAAEVLASLARVPARP
jgi:peroxiredoxin Q/BCP